MIKKKGAMKAKKPAAAKTKAVAEKPAIAGKKGAVSKKEAATMRYKCRICGYVYSPLRGEPHNGIPAGTPFEDLPDTYLCPVCGFQGKGKVGTWGFDEWRPTRYICSMCDYIYDEKRGEPHRGIKREQNLRTFLKIMSVQSAQPIQRLFYGTGMSSSRASHPYMINKKKVFFFKKTCYR